MPDRCKAILTQGPAGPLPATAPIIDTGNYYPPRDGHIREIDAGMVESEWTSRNLGRPVIKTFNNITWGSLQHEGLPRGAKDRIALPIAGDECRSKRLVRDPVETLGFDAFYAGSLSESWRYQPGTPAYCPDPTLKQLPLLLQRGPGKGAKEPGQLLEDDGAGRSRVPATGVGPRCPALCRPGHVQT